MGDTFSRVIVRSSDAIGKGGMVACQKLNHPIANLLIGWKCIRMKSMVEPAPIPFNFHFVLQQLVGLQQSSTTLRFLPQHVLSKLHPITFNSDYCRINLKGLVRP